MPKSRLTLLVCDERGRRMAPSTIEGWLRGVAPPRARGIVNIAVVSDARMRALNRRYRGKDRVTDVLSFPSGGTGRRGGTGRKARALSNRPDLPDPPDQPDLLGDIVIAAGMARRQARAAGHPYTAELRILALHGLLHLLGYDHERDDGQMRRLEGELRRKGGLREGLIERSGPS